jgi:uncharacterized protein (TIGR02996 family)
MTPSSQALEQAFLDDIVTHPEDASLWLILADWLTERDDPRAELVRLTWQLQYEPAHADFSSRQERVQAVLAGGMVPVRPRCALGDFEFAWIPPGSFHMGSLAKEPGHQKNERRHRVTLTTGFWMAVHPVTQAQWQAILGTNPSNFSRTGRRSDRIEDVADAELENYPVDSISWNMAQEFCTRASQLWKRHINLPTEAQWEYACRAGTTSPFHFGWILDGTQANCNGDHPQGTRSPGPNLLRPTPVGLPDYPPNAWGLYEMHGNMWEWCRDAYDASFGKLPAKDPIREKQHAVSCVLRGGSWFSEAYKCRAAYRHHVGPGTGAAALGLRVCCLD